jgi:hypothetical protein
LEQYRRETVWISPIVCCVCGLRRPHDDVEQVVIRRDCQSSLDFSPLHVKDSYLVDSYLVDDSTEFEYGFPSINGSVLEKSGFKTCDESSIALEICIECRTALIEIMGIIHHFSTQTVRLLIQQF